MTLLRFFRRILETCDVIGKSMAFLTLPTTLFAGYVYFDELRDYFSKPNLSTEVERATLRCNYVFRDSEAYWQYTLGQNNELTKLCRSSQIAVSFEFNITNNDSISRELKGLTVRAQIPPYGNLVLNEVQSVEHLILHGVETNERRGWRVEKLDPGTTTTFEIHAFGSTGTNSENIWDRLALAMDSDESIILDSNVIIDLDARLDSFSEPTQTVMTCAFKLDQEEIDQWQNKEPHRQIQITNTCN